METVGDFEDMLVLLEKHQVRYLIIGGLAFIYHAKPRYTKDMDLWVEGTPENVARANRALAEFGSPHLLDPRRPGEILQLGVAPDRIDFFLQIEGPEFQDAWQRRCRGRYGSAGANWIAQEDLIAVKSLIDHPRHAEDVRVLSLVRSGLRSEEEES